MRTLAVLLSLWTLCTLARAQSPDAGPDQVVAWPGAARLDGAVLNASPLEWWTADGNNATENFLLKWSSASGLSAVGPMRNPAGIIYGWPGDFERVGSAIYGVEVALGVIYTLDGATAICTPVGSPYSSQWTDVHSLAYDPAGGVLYGVDLLKKQLLRFDLATGQATPIGSSTLAGWTLIRALAWRASDQRLYALDQGTNKLLRIDPATGTPAVALQLAPAPGTRIDELDFEGDVLYAVSIGLSALGPDNGRLQTIDLATGAATDLGGVIPDASTHALLIQSLPERSEWVQVGGPGVASFADASALDTQVAFTLPGTYQLELRLPDLPVPLADAVTIDVQVGSVYAFCSGDGSAAACPCGNPGGPGEGCANTTGAGGLLAHSGGTSAGADDATLTLSQLPQLQFAIVYTGSAAHLGGLGAPLGDGLRCLGGTTQRYPVASSGASGAISVGSLVGQSGGLIAPGSTWHFQGWYRDFDGPCTGGQNLSNAISITFGP